MIKRKFNTKIYLEIETENSTSKKLILKYDFLLQLADGDVVFYKKGKRKRGCYVTERKFDSTTNTLKIITESFDYDYLQEHK